MNTKVWQDVFKNLSSRRSDKARSTNAGQLPEAPNCIGRSMLHSPITEHEVLHKILQDYGRSPNNAMLAWVKLTQLLGRTDQTRLGGLGGLDGLGGLGGLGGQGGLGGPIDPLENDMTLRRWTREAVRESDRDYRCTVDLPEPCQSRSRRLGECLLHLETVGLGKFSDEATWALGTRTNLWPT
jgi:hypothetical protein